MSELRQIEEAVQKLAGTYLKDLISIQACTVDFVDEDNRVCDCTPIGGDADTGIPGVQLCAENNNGFLVFPAVGSTVIVALSTRNSAFVLFFSDVEKVQFMDGTLGGLPFIKDPDNSNVGLLKKINNLENKVNTIIDKIKLCTIPLAPSGTFVLGADTNIAGLTDLSLTSENDITNLLITQGK